MAFIMVEGSIDDVVIHCLEDSYPDFAWRYSYNGKEAVGVPKHFTSVYNSKWGSVFDAVLSWFSVSGYRIYL